MDNLPKKKFRVMIVKMIKELGRRIVAHSKKSEVFFLKLESKKNNQTEMKNTKK